MIAEAIRTAEHGKLEALDYSQQLMTWLLRCRPILEGKGSLHFVRHVPAVVSLMAQNH